MAKGSKEGGCMAKGSKEGGAWPREVGKNEHRQAESQRRSVTRRDAAAAGQVVSSGGGDGGVRWRRRGKWCQVEAAGRGTVERCSVR